MHKRVMTLAVAALLAAPVFAQQSNTTPAPGTAGERRENQQDRIANGIKSGSMTAGEAAHAENREQGINKQIAADRAANGGKLTAQEKRQINREQNGASRQIYREKHNAAKQLR